MGIQNVTFIGLGVMGYNMAGHLKKNNFNTTVYPNLSTENTDTRVFPNPATNQLTITSDIEISRVSIYDLFGKKMYDKPHQEMAVDVSSLAGGTYIVRVEKTTGFEFFTVSIIR